jgi:hypothetical protein
LLNDATILNILHLTLILNTRMKKLILLVSIFFALNSCTVGSDSDREFILLPIEQVEMPLNYSVGNISIIKIKYKRPTDCHIFNGFYTNYESSNVYDKVVAIRTVKLNNSNCLPDDSMFEVNYEFKPMTAGTYNLRFWLGPDEDGVDQYETHEVEVL